MKNFKEIIAERMLSRAETGLYFLVDFLYRYNAKDAVYFRSILIILSYSFELALKSKVVLKSKNENKEDLEKELKKLNHDVIKISKKLNKNELKSIGIKSIDIRKTTKFIGYVVKTERGKEVSIENFIDVRYDFMKDYLRDLEDHEKVKEGIGEILNICKIIRESI